MGSFKYIRKLCRFEIPRINLLDGSYEFAMYHAMILLQSEPNSVYLKKVIAKSLYSLAKYGNMGYFSSVHVKYKYTQGRFQQLVYMTGKLKGQGISGAALNYCWKLKTEHPDDEELSFICSSLMKNIVFTYEDKKKRVFYQALADTSKAKEKRKSLDDDKEDTDPESASAVKKKKAKTTEEEGDSEDEAVTSKVKVKEYFKRSFIYLFENDSDFARVYKLKLKELKKKSAPTASRGKEKAELAVNKGDEHYVNNTKVLLINPFYNYYDNFGRYDPVTSETNKQRFIDALTATADKLLNEYEVIDQDNLKMDEASKLYEVSILRDCFMENLNKRGVGLVSTDLNIVKEIAAKYKSNNILLTGVGIEEKSFNTAAALILGMYSTIFYPTYLLRHLPDGYQYTLYAVLYNTELDNFRVNYYKVYSGKDTPTALKANLYQIFNRLKTY
jgi:hypothetical protein